MQYQARSFDKYMQTEERRGKRKMVKTKDAVNDMTVGNPGKIDYPVYDSWFFWGIYFNSFTILQIRL